MRAERHRIGSGNARVVFARPGVDAASDVDDLVMAPLRR